MFKNIVVIISFLILALTAFVKPVLAYEVTDFGSCLNPQVSAKQVNAGNGHGVVGYSGTAFSGTDSIYVLPSNNVMQCLCTDNGQGYQTSWVRATNYSSSELATFQSEGWNYFEDASNWGLQGAYLAKTETYSCSGVTPTPMCSETPTPTLTPTPTGTLTPTPTSTPGPTNTPTPGPTNTPTPGPASQATTATLASTGNLMFIYGIVVVGFFSLIVGLILKKFSK